MSPYSVDLRTKIINAYQAGGQSQRQIASRFSVSLTFVHKLIKHFRETGAIEPMPHAGGKERKINSILMEALIEETNANPSATLDHLRSFLSARFGVTVSNATVFRALKREGFKKSRTQFKKAVGRIRKASA